MSIDVQALQYMKPAILYETEEPIFTGMEKVENIEFIKE